MTEPASSTPLQHFSTTLAGLVASASPAVVSVHSHRSVASGFVWRPGLVVTAEETLAEEGEVSITLPNSKVVAAQVVGRDPSTDIALLRIAPSDLTPALLVPSPVAVGSLVIAVGAEQGAPTAVLGLVSHAVGPWRSLRGGEIDARIELDLRLRRSAEGGLALDAAGQAIGMTVFGPRRRVLVIPAATIERVATTLERHGRIARGYLGLSLQSVTIENGQGSGAMIIRVDPRGPGVVAGLHQGDIIATWNGEPIRNVPSLLRALGPDSVGQRVTLGLCRAGETTEVSLIIAERPAS